MTTPPSPWRRRALVLGLSLLAIVLVFQLVLPRVVASQVASAAATALGRRVEIGGLEIAWLPGRVVARDFVIGGPLEASPLAPEESPIRFASLGVDLAWWDLLGGEIHLTELTLDAPSFFLERGERGAVSPLVLAEPDPQEPVAESEGEDAAGWPIRLEAISVRDLAFRLDRSDAEGHREIDLTLAELTLSELGFSDGAIQVGALAFRDPGVQVHRTLGTAPSQPEAIAVEPAPEARAATDVAARPPPGEAAARQAEDSLLERHRLESLDVEGAEFTLLWEGGEPLAASLDLTARDLSLARGERFPFQLELSIEGGRLAVEGEVGARPLSFDGRLDWQDLPLPRLVEAAGLEPGVQLTSGRSSGELRLALAGSEEGTDAAPLEISGQLTVSELDGQLPDLELAWSELVVEARSVRVPLTPGGAPEIELSQVTLRQPRIDYQLVPRADSEPGGEEVVAGEAPEPTEAPEPAALAPRVGIDALDVEDGSLRFRDHTTTPPFDTRWQKVVVTARGLLWPDQDTESLRITARGPGGAKLRVDASLDDGHGSIETRLDRLGLVPLNPYADAYTGISIDEGRSSVRSRLELTDRVMRTQTVIDLHRLSVHEREAGWFQSVFGVPLDLALALLRDLEGDIRVPVNAEFAADGSTVGLASLLLSTLRQAILGAVTSPLKVLGSVKSTASAVFASGLEAIDGVAGEPGLDDSQHERLEALADTLEAKPGLVLVLRGRAGPRDDAGIARRRLIGQARAGESLSGEDTLGFLERRRARRLLAELDPEEAPRPLEPESEELIGRLIAATAPQVDDAARRELGRDRAARARETLVEDFGAPAAAVVVGESSIGDPAVVIELRARSDASQDAPSGPSG